MLIPAFMHVYISCRGGKIFTESPRNGKYFSEFSKDAKTLFYTKYLIFIRVMSGVMAGPWRIKALTWTINEKCIWVWYWGSQKPISSSNLSDSVLYNRSCYSFCPCHSWWKVCSSFPPFDCNLWGYCWPVYSYWFNKIEALKWFQIYLKLLLAH